jgi:hypothetical protein
MDTKINLEEFNWTEKPVIGSALLVMGGTIDSNGEQILFNTRYDVGKHKVTGQVIISPAKPTETNEKK